MQHDIIVTSRVVNIKFWPSGRRPKEMFDGVVERDGKIMKRFTEITKKEAYEK